MAPTESFRYYKGDGSTVKQRGLESPLYKKMVQRDDPAGYVAGDGLRDAVNVALVLGQPLLVTGEPGTGKTQLAGSIAHELELDAPLEFRTKTTSTAKDLFYRYDALRHFNDINIIKKGLTDSDEVPRSSVESSPNSLERLRVSVDDYITYDALGLAIKMAEQKLDAPRRSVVLIDEVDKAPRDFPNDILNEIEEFSFTVGETGNKFKASEAFRPIVLLTSNSEKNLPDAFLRRCVFYNIPPPNHEDLLEIVKRRLDLSMDFLPFVDPLIRHYEEIRGLALKKKPATAELLAWLSVLDKLRLTERAQGQGEALAFTYSILAKNREDSELMLGLASKLKLS